MKGSSVALVLGLCGLSFTGGVYLVRSEARYALRESESIERQNKGLSGGLAYCQEALDAMQKERLERERQFALCVITYEELECARTGDGIKGNMFMGYDEANSLFVEIWLGRSLKRGFAAMKRERDER